ncbi:MAG TPA: type II secretion system F family protein [archaeon]|nr:type II secretion system F family protein [archaeon]
MKSSQSIPFVPIPFPVLKRLVAPFTGVGSIISETLFFLDIQLKQANIKIDKNVYGAIIFFVFFLYFIVFTLIFLAITFFSGNEGFILSPIVGFFFSAIVAVQLISYPSIIVKRRVREIEANLIFALRTVLIQLRAGVPLFDSIKTIASGNFGAISHVFKKAIEKIQTGENEEQVLQDLASENPSWFFRRTIWQLVNGLKTGANVADVLQEIISSMNSAQSVQIQEYGGSLRFFSLIYMMLGVIIPAIGITFLILISSFPQVQITEMFYLVFLVVLVLGQVMFLGAVKSKRPTLLEG